MTITRATGQGTGSNADGAQSIVLAFPGNVTAGNRIVIGIARYNNDAQLPVVGDISKSAGTATLGAFTLDAVADNNFGGSEHIYAAIYSAPVTGTGSCTITVTNAWSGSYWNIGINEYHSDVGAITVEDGANTATGATGAAASANGTSAAGAVFFGAGNFASSGAITITPDTAFSQVYEEEDGSAHSTGSFIDRIVSSGTTDAASWTAPTTTPWAAAVVVYGEPGAINLVVADATHSQSADNAVLTQAHTLTVADTSQAQSADNVVLATSAELVVQDAGHTQAAEGVALTQVHTLAVAGTDHSHSAENATLAVSGLLTVQDAAHAQTVDGVSLVQNVTLAVQDAGHSNFPESPVLVESTALTVADASHAQTAGAVTLTQAHTLAVADASHAQAADSPALTQAHALAVQDVSHTHSADGPVLTQAHNIAVADVSQAQGADAPTLTQAHILTVDDSAQAHQY